MYGLWYNVLLSQQGGWLFDKHKIVPRFPGATAAGHPLGRLNSCKYEHLAWIAGPKGRAKRKNAGTAGQLS
jgi:hypothetical protein